MICPYGAPLTAVLRGDVGTIGQSCCNHWDCPTCGQKRARQEYHRIVEGARELSANNSLYFLTTTCRGREMPLEESENNYGLWTNRLYTRLRAYAGSHGLAFHTATVTERQKRGHPHSHVLSTFAPLDCLPLPYTTKHLYFWSSYFERANVDAGFGIQCRISLASSVDGASRYIAKYLFKEAIFTKWPAHWRRVRYSQNWPKFDQLKPDFARALNSPQDWRAVEKTGQLFQCEDETTYKVAINHIYNIGYYE